MDPLLAKASKLEESPAEGVPLLSKAPSAPAEELHPLKSLGRGSLITLIGQLVTIAALFGVRVLLVRLLSSTLYGDLSVGISLTTILASLCALGIPNAAARQLAHTVNPEERRKLVVLALGIVVPSAILSGIALFFAAPLFGDLYGGNSSVTLVVRFMAINMTFVILYGLLGAFFQGNENAFPNALFSQILNPILVVGLLIVLLPRSPTLTTVVTAYIVAGAVTLASLTAYTLSSHGYPWRRAGSVEVLRGAAPTLTRGGLLLFAAPLAVVAIAAAADGQVDTLVLGIFRSASVVGAYNSVLPLARLVALVVTGLAYIMLPVAARLHRLNDMPELRRSYATITKWVVVVTLPFFLTFFFIPGPTLSLVYGSGFLSQNGYGLTPELLQITCLGGIGATLMGPSPSVLIGVGRFRYLLIYTVASAVADTGLAIALCPFWGSIGAAIANAVATAMLPALCTLDAYRSTGVHPFSPEMAKPALASGVPAAIILAILYGPLGWRPGDAGLVLVFLLLLAISFGAVAATRSVEMEDGHLLEVAEEYLGRPLPALRRLGRRFLRKGSELGSK
jgi:O-antigen/teichoic acid export membrane protein